MKSLVTVAIAFGALIALSAGSSASANVIDDAKKTVSNALVLDGQHDVCVGTLGSDGTQYPWFCINL